MIAASLCLGVAIAVSWIHLKVFPRPIPPVSPPTVDTRIVFKETALLTDPIKEKIRSSMHSFDSYLFRLGIEPPTKMSGA